jgi:hypothetical protein
MPPRKTSIKQEKRGLAMTAKVLEGKTQLEVGRQFGVSHQAVSKALNSPVGRELVKILRAKLSGNMAQRAFERLEYLVYSPLEAQPDSEGKIPYSEIQRLDQAYKASCRVLEAIAVLPSPLAALHQAAQNADRNAELAPRIFALLKEHMLTPVEPYKPDDACIDITPQSDTPAD